MTEPVLAGPALPLRLVGALHEVVDSLLTSERDGRDRWPDRSPESTPSRRRGAPDQPTTLPIGREAAKRGDADQIATCTRTRRESSPSGVAGVTRRGLVGASDPSRPHVTWGFRSPCNRLPDDCYGAPPQRFLPVDFPRVHRLDPWSSGRRPRIRTAFRRFVHRCGRSCGFSGADMEADRR